MISLCAVPFGSCRGTSIVPRGLTWSVLSLQEAQCYVLMVIKQFFHLVGGFHICKTTQEMCIKYYTQVLERGAKEEDMGGGLSREDPIGSWSVTGAAKMFSKYVNLIIPFFHSESFNGYSLLFQKRLKSLQGPLASVHLIFVHHSSPCSQLCSCTVPLSMS